MGHERNEKRIQRSAAFQNIFLQIKDHPLEGVAGKSAQLCLSLEREAKFFQQLQSDSRHMNLLELIGVLCARFEIAVTLMESYKAINQIADKFFSNKIEYIESLTNQILKSSSADCFRQLHTMQSIFDSAAKILQNHDADELKNNMIAYFGSIYPVLERAMEIASTPTATSERMPSRLSF